MKKISVLIPCYNEEENVVPISEAVIKTLQKDLPEYDYELVFIDNDSQDHTRSLIRQLCDENPKIKAIFNARNFGQFNSPYYGMLQITGDCVIEMVADFQDPVELIPQYVHEWEKGYKIVIGIKTSSKENRLMYWLRGCYYKMMKKLSDVEQIEQFTGSGLYDRDFIEVLRNLDDPTPFLRGIVAELGFKIKQIPYEQPKRRAGETKIILPALRCGNAQHYFLYEGGTSSGDYFRKHLFSHQHGGGCGLSGHEADVLGPFSGRYGAGAHRHVFPRVRADLLYRPYGRIHSVHQC